MVWWLVLLSGITSLIFGLLTITWPVITLVILTYFFAFYALFAGVINIIQGITGVSNNKVWYLLLILGAIQVAASIYVLQFPGLSILTFVLIMGFIFMIQGILEIIGAFLEKSGGSMALEIILGALGLIAGFAIIRYPIQGGLAFLWVLGVYGIVGGAIRIGIAIATHSALEKVTKKS